MPYAISVMRVLAQDFGIAVDCICWDDARKKTPFVPVNEPGITFHKRSSFTRESIIQFIEGKNPPLLYISGRMDKLYLEAVLHFKDKIKIISACDNQWDGSLKNKIAALTSKWVYKKYFEYFWVPSQRSYEYTRRMGYAKNKIVRNMYTGDANIFPKAFLDYKAAKKEKYPHELVYVGRFAKVKGLDLLVEAFTQAKNEVKNDWSLTLVGAGDVPVTATADIKVKGFMTPQELANGSRNWGVFCLPSTKEPWGVVVHEFTMAGLPVICSDNVGAGDSLVINNYNGFVFESGNLAALKIALIEMMAIPDEELWEMANRSHELSKYQSPTIAAYCLLSIL